MVGNAWSEPPRPAVARSTAAGLVAALVGALAWAVVVDVSGFKIGVAAVGIGLGVGQTMALTASRSHRLPLIAAGLALTGGVLGDLLVDLHAVAEVIGIGTLDLLSRVAGHPRLLGEIFKAGFHPQDVLFWAVAAGAAYRLTARGVQRMDRLPVAPPMRATARPSGPDFGHGPARPPAPAPASTTARHPSQFFNSATTKVTADAPIPMPVPSVAAQLAVTIQDTVAPRPAAAPRTLPGLTAPRPTPGPSAARPGPSPVLGLAGPAGTPTPTGPFGPDGRPMIPAQPQRPPEPTLTGAPAAPAAAVAPVRRPARRQIVTRDF